MGRNPGLRREQAEIYRGSSGIYRRPALVEPMLLGYMPGAISSVGIKSILATISSS